MKFIKTGLVKVLFSLFLLTMVASIVPVQALAFKMNVNNTYPHNLYVALLDWNDSVGDWRCHGWFTVEPYSNRVLNIPSSTEGTNVYVYAHTSEASFGGDGYASAIPRMVVNEAFDYYNPNYTPRGKNPRSVLFVPYEIENGYVDFTP